MTDFYFANTNYFASCFIEKILQFNFKNIFSLLIINIRFNDFFKYWSLECDDLPIFNYVSHLFGRMNKHDWPIDQLSVDRLTNVNLDNEKGIRFVFQICRLSKQICFYDDFIVILCR